MPVLIAVNAMRSGYQILMNVVLCTKLIAMNGFESKLLLLVHNNVSVPLAHVEYFGSC